MLNRLKNKKGIALILFLALLLMLTLIGVLAINNSFVNMDVSGNRGKTNDLLYAAEAGVEKAFAFIDNYYDHNDTVMQMSSWPSDTFTLGGNSVGYYTLCDSSTTDTLNACNDWFVGGRTSSPSAFRGIWCQSMGYVIVAEAWTPQLPNKVRIKQQVAVYHIPVFCFAAFYDTFDLEISPEVLTGVFVPFSINGEGGGGIHSNKDIYVEAPVQLIWQGRLPLQARVTAAGAIYHGHDTTTYKGPWPNDVTYVSWGASDSIRITDAIGVFRPMKDATGWLDHNHSDWVHSSLTRWKGTVEDGAHQISDLNLKMVLPEGKKPYDLIERALPFKKPANSVSLENVAGLIIYSTANNDTGAGDIALFREANGSWTNCTDTLFRTPIEPTEGDSFVVRRNKTFYDYREQVDTVLSYILNIHRLSQHTRFYPTNGIIYITRKSLRPVKPTTYTTMCAVIITRATDLPQATTIVSNAPVYILGKFNIVLHGADPAPQPAAIIADAVTILSKTISPPNWHFDAESTSHYDGLENRIAQNDTVNACIMAGNRPTTSSNYSGGLWNLARLLEDWCSSGTRSLTINGSLTCFWRSKEATRPYRFPRGVFPTEPDSVYYVRPNLIIAYDERISNSWMSQQPPGTPQINLTAKTKRSVEEL
jgi:hypothetical protein